MKVVFSLNNEPSYRLDFKKTDFTNEHYKIFESENGKTIERKPDFSDWISQKNHYQRLSNDTNIVNTPMHFWKQFNISIKMAATCSINSIIILVLFKRKIIECVLTWNNFVKILVKCSHQ